MNVLIEKEIFEQATTEEQKLELSFLLYLIWYQNRYSLILNEDVRNSQFVNGLKDTDIQLLELCFTKTIAGSLTADCTIKTIGDTISDQKVFSVSEGIKYLMQPSSIIIENSFNDAHFIRAIMRCYDSSGMLIVHDQEGWLQFENAGGCGNIINYIQSRINQCGKVKFLRCFVIVDGDKYCPTETGTKYESLKKKLKEWKIGYHILEKRCMENYMPIDAIPTNSTTFHWKRAYQNLTPQQRDFLNIGKGFYGDLTESPYKNTEHISKRKRKRVFKKVTRTFRNTDISTFYQSVSNEDFRALCKGIGIKDFKTKFPEFFDDQIHVYRKAFDELISHQQNTKELEEIVNALRKLI